MLLIIINWLYVLLLSMGIGASVLRISCPKGGSPRLAYAVICGLSLIAFGANLFSLFFHVGLLYNLLIAMLALWGFWQLPGGYGQMLWRRAKAQHWIEYVFFGLIVFVVLLKSASPTEILDEGGYFLQYIKWIENYSVVPGLANVQDRFGFNSSWHILSAVFSFSWLSGSKFYELNGFLLLVLGGYFIFGTTKELRSERKVSAFVKFLVCIFLFRNFITSSASDLSNNYLSFFALVLALEKIEEKSVKQFDDKLISLFLTVLLVSTIKISSVLNVLLLVPFIVPFRAKILLSLFVASIIYAAPWVLRFYFMTGYLVFPVYQVDFFEPDWKLPNTAIVTSYNGVSSFAKNSQLPTELVATMNVNEWFPLWLVRLPGEQKLFFFSTLFCFLLSSIFVLSKKYEWRLKFLFVFLMGCILYWLFHYPAFRFAWGWILAFNLLAWTLFAFDYLKLKRKYALWAVVLLLGLGTVRNVTKTVIETRSYFSSIVVKQAPFPAHNAEKVEINNFSSQLANPCWDAPLPCVLPWYNRI